jgi:polygalacturonase
MKNLCLSFALALIVNGHAAHAASPVDSSAGSILPSDADRVSYKRSESGAAARTATVALSERSSVKDWGAAGDGIHDDQPAIQAAIDTLHAAGGGALYVPKGVYLLKRSLDRKPGIYLRGEGPGLTELRASGNFAVITSIGSKTSVRNRGGASDMLIRCGGKANADAHGIYETWNNRTTYRNLRLHSCRYGMYASNVWQVEWNTVHADGEGTDQNYIGFYMAEVDPTNPNNAVQGVNLMAQDVEYVGFRLVNFNGSKFVNSEAAGTMVHGWYLGDPTTGTEPIRWGHFVNCLADSTKSHGWRLEKGAAAFFKHVQFANVWSGNTGGSGWHVVGVSEILISAPMVVTTKQSAMHFIESSRIVISGGQLVEYDRADGAGDGIRLENSHRVAIGASHIYSDSFRSRAIREMGSADHNMATGNWLERSFVKLGPNSRFTRNNGAVSEGGGAVSFKSEDTSVTVRHGLVIPPAIHAVRITALDDGGKCRRLWVSNVTATAFRVNCDVAPGRQIHVGWSIDSIR